MNSGKANPLVHAGLGSTASILFINNRFQGINFDYRYDNVLWLIPYMNTGRLREIDAQVSS